MVFAVLLLNYAVFSVFALEKSFGLFPADHADSSYILLKTRFFLSGAKLRCFQLFCTGKKVPACLLLKSLISKHGVI